MSYKSGFVAIVGRPNSGKSTLLNSLIKEKVSIISEKPQTTRNTVRGVLTGESYQIVFTDTPGIYMPQNKLGEMMVRLAQETFKNTDLIIYIVDAAARNVSSGEDHIIDLLKKTNKPVILVLNKTDIVRDKNALLPIIDSLSKKMEFTAIFPVSALKSLNTDMITDKIIELLPEGAMLYPDDIYTDQTERFLVAEIIREKLFRGLDEEIPYGTHVEILTFIEKPEKEIVHISANIYCEKNSHKAIIIGKNGMFLKKIGTEARKDMEEVLGMHVFLELWVKIKNEWRNDERFLRNIGF